MQNRYSGDVGDFSKLGLLRCLAKNGLSIGLNWYLTPDEKHNDDGRFVHYLKDCFKEKEKYRQCDPELWDRLKQIVDQNHRSVSSLEHPDLIPAVYWHKPLDFTKKAKQERAAIRAQWNKGASQKLSGLDIVCVDPDNGLIVRSAEGKPKSNKYVLPKELECYYQNGSSVIYYQHKARKTDKFYLDQHNKLLNSGKYPGATGLCLKFQKMSLRYYFFIVQPRHRQIIEACIDEMKTQWNGLFERLEIPTDRSVDHE